MEYKLPSSRKRYDFFLPDYKILIEYDGIQHFKPVKKFGGYKTFNKRKSTDYYKNRLALKHGYTLYRIKYTDINRIEEIVETILKKHQRAPIISNNNK